MSREAFGNLKLPEAVRNEFVGAFIEACAPVPVTQQGWRRLEVAIGDAAGRALELMVHLGDKSDLLDEDVSLLVRDPSNRAYDMTVLVDTSSTHPPPPLPPQPSPAARPNQPCQQRSSCSSCTDLWSVCTWMWSIKCTRHDAQPRNGRSGATGQDARLQAHVAPCVQSLLCVPPFHPEKGLSRPAWELWRPQRSAQYAMCHRNHGFMAPHALPSPLPPSGSSFAQYKIWSRPSGDVLQLSSEDVSACRAARAGQVYAEARIPHCADRGIGALWDGDARSTPRTVHHPCPACTTSCSDSLVEVDSPLLGMTADTLSASQPLACAPARATFEGDNLLIVPAYRSASHPFARCMPDVADTL